MLISGRPYAKCELQCHSAEQVSLSNAFGNIINDARTALPIFRRAIIVHKAKNYPFLPFWGQNYRRAPKCSPKLSYGNAKMVNLLLYVRPKTVKLSYIWQHCARMLLSTCATAGQALLGGVRVILCKICITILNFLTETHVQQKFLQLNAVEHL